MVKKQPIIPLPSRVLPNVTIYNGRNNIAANSSPWLEIRRKVTKFVMSREMSGEDKLPKLIEMVSPNIKGAIRRKEENTLYG
jgi:hypothetical protein